MFLKNDKNAGDNTHTRTYVDAELNNKKTFVVNPKETKENAEKTKSDLRERVNPANMGVSLALGKQARKGGVILKCFNKSADTKTVQNKIQKGLRDAYEVVEKNLLKNRIKVIEIDKFEHDKNDEAIIKCIISQNKLDVTLCILTVLFRSALKNNRFNIILKTNKYAFKILMSKGKVGIGWGIYRAVQEFGVVRCYNCNQYGHISKVCRKKKLHVLLAWVVIL